MLFRYAYLVRHTLGFSKDLAMYRASAAWEDAIYNFVRPVKTLRQEVLELPGRRWLPRTPAMAAKLTDHVWTVNITTKSCITTKSRLLQRKVGYYNEKSRFLRFDGRRLSRARVRLRCDRYAA